VVLGAAQLRLVVLSLRFPGSLHTAHNIHCVMLLLRTSHDAAVQGTASVSRQMLLRMTLLLRMPDPHFGGSEETHQKYRRMPQQRRKVSRPATVQLLT
jgi:hypothetical protein